MSEVQTSEANAENVDSAEEKGSGEEVEKEEIKEDTEEDNKEETQEDRKEEVQKEEVKEEVQEEKEENEIVDAEIVEEIKEVEEIDPEAAKHTIVTRKLRYGRSFLMEIFCVIVIIFILLGFIFGVDSAPNDDMYPVAASGDVLVYYRMDKDVRSQDIIVFKNGGSTRVSRVIARGGDTIDITDAGTVVVNGNTIIEPNIHIATYRFEGYVDYPITLKEDECFVLCEARNGTEDSRYFGPVSKNSIKGTVITVIRRNHL